MDARPAPTTSAKAAGLRYDSDQGLGLGRVRRGRSFRYVDQKGRPLRDPETLARIKALAIPPAWRDVWICPDPRGHLQATGRDEKGRKQYRYHPHWRATRDETKYGRMAAFGRVLPALRARVSRDMERPGLPREKVVATVVRLLETTMIRVGNGEYAKQNHSYGLTTLRDDHVRLSGTTLRFQFRGKSGIRHAIDLTDRRLAGIVRRCRDLAGQELFQYRDDEGRVRDIGSADVNAYLREITGQDFTAKDFRTWCGTVLAAVALREYQAVDSQAQAKKNIVRAIESVAERLGNTPTVCRKCYVHPAILEAYLDGATIATIRQRAGQELAESLGDLSPEEVAVLALLQRRLTLSATRSRRTATRESA